MKATDFTVPGVTGVAVVTAPMVVTTPPPSPAYVIYPTISGAAVTGVSTVAALIAAVACVIFA